MDRLDNQRLSRCVSGIDQIHLYHQIPSAQPTSQTHNGDCPQHTMETQEDRSRQETESNAPCTHAYAKTPIARPTHLTGRYPHVLSVSWVIEPGADAYTGPPRWYHPYHRLARSTCVTALGASPTESGNPGALFEILGDRLYTARCLAGRGEGGGTRSRVTPGNTW